MLGYGMVSFTAYAASYWGAPHAERVFGIAKSELGWLVGAPAALAGFLGVILGGRVADGLQARFGNGRVMVILFGLLAPVVPVWIAYTTASWPTFVVTSFLGVMFSSSALGAAAATTQSLVLPRMRGTATATFFLATTLVGLALGPFMAGYVSATNGDDLGLGVLSTLVAAPIGTLLLIAALKLVPQALHSLREAGDRGRGSARLGFEFGCWSFQHPASDPCAAVASGIRAVIVGRGVEHDCGAVSIEDRCLDR